jgi:membrane-associated phospholipid phosphatase
MPASNVSDIKPLALSKPAMRGVIIAAILLWVVAILLWMQGGLDKWVLLSHADLRANGLAAGIGSGVTRYGMSVIVLVYLVYLAFAFKFAELREAYRIYAVVLLLFGLAGPAGDILKEIVNRPRPFVEYAGEISGLRRVHSPSFPSGHATKSVALALPFLLFITTRDRWHKALKILLMILALGVCYSRVMLGAHFLSDVLAGVGTALICVPPVMLLTNKMLRRMKSRIPPRAVIVWAVVLAGLMVYMAVN